jgi:hypothetical protein
MTTNRDIRRALYAEQAQRRQELTERQAAEREAQGLELYPLATWHAFAPDQLAEVIAGVTRCDAERSAALVARLITGTGPHEFGTERRDPFEFGRLIGGALWRIERDGVSAYVLHMLQSEPCGVA